MILLQLHQGVQSYYLALFQLKHPLNIQFWFYETALGGYHGLFTFNIPSGSYLHPDLWYLFGFPLDKGYRSDNTDAEIHLQSSDAQYLMTDGGSGVATKAMVKGEVVEFIGLRWDLKRHS